MPKINRTSGLLLIVVSVLITSGIYDYHNKLSLAPQSVHHWRQSDCASITYNFYNQDLPFWKPKIMGLVSDSGRSALNLTSEVPLYYWGVAQLYKVFGPHESILRGINAAIFVTGIVTFIYFLWLYSGSLLWSIMAGLLLFSSPVLVYYGNNYLSNAPAFGLALMALGMLMNFFRTERQKYWWLATIFFLLAGSLKITGLFLFLALVGSALLFRKSFRQIKASMLITALLVVILPLFSWLLFARFTNHAHHTVYFSTTVFPLWELSADDISYILAEIKKLWLRDYAHWSLLSFYAFLILLIFLRPGLFSFRWRIILILLIVGLAAFSLLQFYTFMQHDYYVINMYILPAVAMVAFSSITRKNPKILTSAFFLVPVVSLLLFNIHYAAGRHDFRYSGFHNDVKAEFAVLYDNMNQWLAHQGVYEEDTVIFIADASHTSLYLMRRFGWTTHKMAFKDTSLDLYFNRDSAGVATSVSNGASFLVINNWYDLYSTRSYLLPFTNHLVAKKGDLMVFDLKDTARNFSLPERQLDRVILMEPDSSNSVFKTGEIVNLTDAPTGNKAIRVWESEVFNFSVDIDELKPGSLVQYELWIKADPGRKLVPVISSIEPGMLFLEKPVSIEETNDWRLLRQEYLVREAVAEKGIKCFFWNPENTEAWVDAITIRIYDPLKSSDL